MIINGDRGVPSLKRIIAFAGFVSMSGAFCLAAWKGTISAEMFLTYPIGLVILYVPQLAIRLLQLWKSRADGADSTTTEGGQ